MMCIKMHFYCTICCMALQGGGPGDRKCFIATLSFVAMYI